MKSSIGIASLALVVGFGIGSTATGTAIAEETSVATSIPQGDLLKVCIDKKTGAIRAASKCKPTERAYVLGGPGPQGIQGIQGERGLQGERGFTGATGATGSVSGLSTQTIDFLSASSYGCPGYGSSKTVLTDVTLSTFMGTARIYPTTTRLNGCSMTVLTR